MAHSFRICLVIYYPSWDRFLTLVKEISIYYLLLIQALPENISLIFIHSSDRFTKFCPIFFSRIFSIRIKFNSVTERPEAFLIVDETIEAQSLSYLQGVGILEWPWFQQSPAVQEIPVCVKNRALNRQGEMVYIGLWIHSQAWHWPL
jgi:hypothetical protein